MVTHSIWLDHTTVSRFAASVFPHPLFKRLKVRLFNGGFRPARATIGWFFFSYRFFVGTRVMLDAMLKPTLTLDVLGPHFCKVGQACLGLFAVGNWRGAIR